MLIVEDSMGQMLLKALDFSMAFQTMTLQRHYRH